MTTDDPPSNEKSASKESTASAIRKAREVSITNESLTTVRSEIQSLAATMGSVSLSLLELQSAAKFQSEKAEQTRRESLAQMSALIDSAKTSFNAMASTIERYPGQVDKHLKTLTEESNRRESQAKWKLYGGLLLVVIASSLSAWGGWSWRDASALEITTDYQAFTDYMMRNHRQVVEKYWKLYKAEQANQPKKK